MRPIWKGAISFGLANIPVSIYSATLSHAIDLDLLHKKDLSPVRYARFCKEENREIPYEEIIKGYMVKGHGYVTLDENDFKSADAKKTSLISIIEFVSKKEIDEIYYEKPYFLSPNKGAEMPYALLREGLARSDKVGIAKFVLRNKEHLATVAPMRNVILLNQLRFASEIRNENDLELPAEGVVEEQLDIALALIGQMTKKFQPAGFYDTYKEKLEQLIMEKAAGKEIKAPSYKPPEATKMNEVMKRLKESLKEQEQGK